MGELGNAAGKTRPAAPFDRRPYAFRHHDGVARLRYRRVEEHGRAAKFHRKRSIGDWDRDPEFREGDFFDLKDFDHGIWEYAYLRARGNTIEAGTSEIQRNIIAERVLGLPKSY